MNPADEPSKADRPATLALLLLHAGETDKAGRLLLDSYGALLRGLFMRNSLRDFADEMLADTFISFLNVEKPLKDPGAAEAYLFQIARNRVLDQARRQKTLKRGGGVEGGPAEVLLDDEELLEALAQRDEPAEDPNWIRELKECIEVAMATMRKAMPAATEALWLSYRDYTAEEVAIYYGADPHGLTSRLLANARQRISDACKKARPYFMHCKD